MYQKNVDNGYIVSVAEVSNSDVNLISEEEYNTILNTMINCPHEDGYYFVLKEDLTWEKRELVEDDDATEEDYVNALSKLGVDTDEEE